MAREEIVLEGDRFLALIRPKLKLKCELDLRILANHGPASVVTRTGDLDNRLKTLLDGPRCP